MPTRRITVEEVLEACRVTGMKPGCGGYVWETHRDISGMSASGMGVMLASLGYDFNRSYFGDVADDLFGGDYSRGFERGFDGMPSMAKYFSDDYAIGYADGTAVRQAVFQEQGAAQ